MRDRAGGPTPVTVLFLLPPKIPDSRTQAAVDEALKRNAIGKRNNAILTASFERMRMDGSA
ncbi:MAG: hypothetical protein H0W71_01425 [Sphingomonas sp.]|nr:hypothetical protein [Sphingomonas sp.]